MKSLDTELSQLIKDHLHWHGRVDGFYYFLHLRNYFISLLYKLIFCNFSSYSILGIPYCQSENRSVQKHDLVYHAFRLGIQPLIQSSILTYFVLLLASHKDEFEYNDLFHSTFKEFRPNHLQFAKIFFWKSCLEFLPEWRREERSHWFSPWDVAPAPPHWTLKGRLSEKSFRISPDLSSSL